MINELTDKCLDIIRQSLSEDGDVEVVDNTSETVDTALGYFERNGDHQAVRDAMTARFAVGITKLDGEAGYETYTKKRVAEQIESGEIEVITTGIGTQIASKTANLFNMPTQSWSYLDDNGNDSEDTAEVINANRKLGGFDTEVTNADFISSAIESGPMLVSYYSGSLQYQAFSPTCLYAIYHDYVMEDGQDRGVDYTDLEDATAVVVKLSGSGTSYGYNQYLAIFGRSDQYENGRYVTYESANWQDIPDVGDPNANDWVTDSGEIANPLSWLANQEPDECIPEYPIVIFRGGIMVSDETFAPTNTSLFENSVEIDISMSRALKDVLNAARGKDVIKNPNGAPLPRSLEGNVVLQTGQELDTDGRDASHAEKALGVAKDIARAVAEGYDVPGFMAVSDDSSQAESGVALTVRLQPLISRRDRRIDLNSSDVHRLYLIERGLINTHTDQGLSYDVDQVWNPGRYIIPETQVEKVTGIKAAQDAQYIDYVRAVRDYHDFPTDREAEEFIDLMAERAIEYPSPRGRVQAQPIGLNRV